MMPQNQKEVWLRGITIPDLSPILQPAANAFLEAAEEISAFLVDFPESELWIKPAECAAVGFHLRHIPGFLDRLSTYADGKILSQEQLDYLKSEEVPNQQTLAELTKGTIDSLHQMVEKLKTYPTVVLTEPRYVGRAKLPTTTIGLLFHAAEHTMRHTGQLLVTTRIIKSQQK